MESPGCWETARPYLLSPRSCQTVLCSLVHLLQSHTKFLSLGALVRVAAANFGIAADPCISRSSTAHSGVLSAVECFEIEDTSF